MTRGDKSAYSAHQKRRAAAIERSYRKHGTSTRQAAARAWATINRQDGGGDRAGSGRRKPAAARRAARSASARQAARTRRVGHR